MAATLIDPTLHTELIELQRAVFTATERLYALPREEPAGPLREEVRQAAAARDTALHASGLVGEHGYHQASQALKNTAKS
ncbi:hypothetical protein [Streptomyces phytohabitans]|uniref:hypothetical protein n=1 Tax=Streptomyces phytohabitans TaxID=1150371 RepID=UPI00345B51EF